MASGVKCIECHTTISRGHSLEEVKRACVQCHEARYGKMTDEWQREISDRMKKLKLHLEALRFQKKMVPEPEKGKVESLIKEVEDFLKAVDEDKSKGVHNFFYTKKLVLKAEEKLLFAKKTLSK